ncbi:MAG: RNA polymerase sigma-70 factor (ECF subfamily) [Myxococcota bacterium]|jgi:RNA polymerase sigma-70 factor (ECF subfamily)
MPDPAPRLEEASDEELMAMYCHQKQRAAFEELFRRYGGRLQGYFIRVTSSPELARDMVQQTFMHVHRARADFRHGSPFRPWFYTIAHNIRREHFRRRARKPEVIYDPERHGEPQTGPSVSSATDRAVRRALQQLDPAQREVVVLHWYEGLTFREIGETVGASTSAVKVRAHRAYKKLRSYLQEDG